MSGISYEEVMSKKPDIKIFSKSFFSHQIVKKHLKIIFFATIVLVIGFNLLVQVSSTVAIVLFAVLGFLIAMNVFGLLNSRSQIIEVWEETYVQEYFKGAERQKTVDFEIEKLFFILEDLHDSELDGDNEIGVNIIEDGFEVYMDAVLILDDNCAVPTLEFGFIPADKNPLDDVSVHDSPKIYMSYSSVKDHYERLQLEKK